MTRLIRVLSLFTILLFVGALDPESAQSSNKKKKVDQLKPVVVQAEKMVESPPLSDLLATAASPTGMINAGEDGSEVNELNTEVERTPASKAGSVDGALQVSSGKSGANNILSMPGPLFTFEGLADVDNAGLVNPPDTNGDVGPNHYVEMVNNRVRVFNKTGAPLTPPFSLSTLFAPLGGICSTQDNGDPIILYDRIANRWLLSQFAFITTTTPPFHECVAISRSGDPTGKYYLYDFVTPGDSFPDYPKLAAWPDGYYMTSRQFNPNFNGHGAFAFDRTKMLAGNPTASLIYFNVPFTSASTSSSGMLPSDHDGVLPPPTGTPNVFAIYTSDDFVPPDPEGDAVRLFDFHADFQTPSNSTFTERPESPLVVAAFDPRNPGGRADVEEPAPGENIDTIGDRLMQRLAYRNRNGTESLVTVHTVNVSGQNGATPATHQAGIRYYELRRTSPASPFSVYDQGTFAPDSGNGATGTNRWMGSAAIDNEGNLAVGFSASSTSLFPAINYAGRASNELGGLLQGEATMFPGQGTMGAGDGNRWGDYTSLSVDPVDECTFYHANEYWPPGNTTFNWHTRIGTFRFPVCTSPQQGILTGKVTSCQTGAPLSDGIVSVSGGPSNGYSAGTDSNGNYSISLVPGSYTATASDTFRNCNENPTKSVTISNGGTTTANFCISGNAKINLATVAVDDSGGNNNGVINLDECVAINVTIRNDGCKIAKNVSATLSTTTPGVTVKQTSSNFPNIPIDATGTNQTPYRIETSPNFACGTPINFSLKVKATGGNTTLTFSLPTCAGAPQSVSGVIATGDQTSVDGRLGRNGIASACDPAKGCPGPLGTGPRRFDSFTFSNPATVPACLTINLNSACGATILGSAYLNNFVPSNLCTNYLGDAGASAPSVTFSAKVPAGQNMIFVVMEANPPPAADNCAYSATVTGFYDVTPDGGPCP